MSRHACSLSFYSDLNLFIVGAMGVLFAENYFEQTEKYVEQSSRCTFISPKPAFHQPLHFIFSLHFVSLITVSVKWNINGHWMCLRFIERAFHYIVTLYSLMHFIRCSNQFEKKPSDNMQIQNGAPFTLYACKQNTDFYTAHWAIEMLISGSHKSLFEEFSMQRNDRFEIWKSKLNSHWRKKN